jgi:hypothetical protein
MQTVLQDAEDRLSFWLLNAGGLSNMKFRCPVCFFAALPYPPGDYNICLCCGTEFGNDDTEFTHEQLLLKWVDAGAPWFYENPPEGWNPWSQLVDGGRPELGLALQHVSYYEALWGNSSLGDNASNERNAIQSLPSNEKAMAHSMIG